MQVDDYKDIIDRKRPILHHHPMEIAHRAKQFAPFAALKGFEETVGKQEVIYSERPILSEDQKEILDRKLAMLKEGEMRGGGGKSAGDREGNRENSPGSKKESSIGNNIERSTGSNIERTIGSNKESNIGSNMVTVTWFESNYITWTKRITNQVKRKADEEVRLYKKLHEEDRMSDDLGLSHRMTGRVYFRDHILWIEGMDEGIPVEHITDIQMVGPEEGNGSSEV